MGEGDRAISKSKKTKPSKSSQPSGASASASASEGAERRNHPRYAAPCLKVVIANGTFETINWSMGGMLLGGYDGPLSAGSIFKITQLGKADGGVMNDVLIHARVVRVENVGRDLVFDFMEVDGRGYALLQAFMAERMALLNEENPIF